VALEAMSEFWDGRPDYREYVSFDSEAFWDDISPESVFVARTFNDYCRAKDAQGDGRLLDMLEMKMPEVTKFGFLLEIQINKLIECVRGAASGGPDGDGDEEMEEESVQREFIVEQMLHMAISFDYSDEVGRRKMFGLMREALTMPELPEESTRLSVETLRLVCGDDRSDKGESDFCGIVLEAIAEVHDTIMGDEADKTKSSTGEESFHSARSEVSNDGSAKRGKNSKRSENDDEEEEDDDEEKAIREIMVNMKCLHIAQCMLQNIQCELEQTVHLVTMLNNLVIPAVRSQEAPIRERGLVCLGLCCLLGKVCITGVVHPDDLSLTYCRTLRKRTLPSSCIVSPKVTHPCKPSHFKSSQISSQHTRHYSPLLYHQEMATKRLPQSPLLSHHHYSSLSSRPFPNR
jgi:condensin complex subunit 3